METAAARLQRFQQGPPQEVIATLLNSINNHFNVEIREAAKAGCWSLAFMGVHAVTQMVSYALVDAQGEAGFRRFLLEFVDQDSPGADFSAVASELHQWRNVLVHQWLSTAGHSLGFDLTLDRGWVRQGDLLIVNPGTLIDGYRRAFSSASPTWRQYKLRSPAELEAIKQRLIDSTSSVRPGQRGSEHGAGVPRRAGDSCGCHRAHRPDRTPDVHVTSASCDKLQGCDLQAVSASGRECLEPWSVPRLSAHEHERARGPDART
jgi:hypothetical protein